MLLWGAYRVAAHLLARKWRNKNRLPNGEASSSLRNYFKRIVFVVVLVERPLFTDVRIRTLPLLVVRAVEFIRIFIALPTIIPPFLTYLSPYT